MTSVESRCTGSMVGLAIGDALGYPAEFRRREQILREIGPEGITDFIGLRDDRFSRPIILGERKAPGTFTDDTQMTLAIAEGLLEADLANLDELMPAIGRHFIEWSRADDNDRCPGETCLTGCENLAAGMPWREAGVAQSKGCGSAMRVAPIGLVYDDLERVAEVARASSLLTHGHDAALEGAAACALMVAMALEDATPEQMHKEVRMLCSGRSRDFDARWAEVPEAVSQPPEVALSERGLGEAWVAEEAAASALYCVWRAPEDYSEAVLMAVNTDGDSDSIACITGSVMGARLGLEAIPERWRSGVEKSEELHEMGRKLCARRTQGVGR